MKEIRLYHIKNYRVRFSIRQRDKHMVRTNSNIFSMWQSNFLRYTSHTWTGTHGRFRHRQWRGPLSFIRHCLSADRFFDAEQRAHPSVFTMETLDERSPQAKMTQPTSADRCRRLLCGLADYTDVRQTIFTEEVCVSPTNVLGTVWLYRLTLV